MSKECEQKFGYGTPRYNICTGNTKMPHWKVDSYREKWGMPLLFNEAKPETNCDKAVPVVSHNIEVLNQDYGPGTELIEIYSSMGVPPCQACYDLAKKMNQWGIHECEERIEEIVEDILPRAMNWLTDNRPWISKMFPNILTESAARIKIKSDVKKAIELSKKQLKNRKSTFTTCGSCGKKKA